MLRPVQAKFYRRFSFPRSVLAGFLAGTAAAAVSFASVPCEAQPLPVPVRSDAWGQASNVMAVSAAGLVLVMPRVFYSDPEVTAGWKARWHLSALAPIMTLTTISLLNEQSLKDSFASPRPGCDDTNQGAVGCTSFGMFSTQSFLAFGALGAGAAVFLVDTVKWNDGRFNVGAFVGDIGVPAVLAVIVAVGRSSGNWESGGQVWGSAGIGLGAGLGTGLLYSLLQRPECGYSGNLVCW